MFFPYEREIKRDTKIMKQKQLKNMLAATVALLITMIGMPQKAQAATKYGFHVGGVYVTSDNYTNITGSNIKPNNEATDNAVWYNPETNTLYVRNTRIERSGGSKRCIENETNDGLRIVFIGNCYFHSKNSEAIRCHRNTTLTGRTPACEDRIWISSGEYEGLFVENKSHVTVKDMIVDTWSEKNYAILGEKQEELTLRNVIINCYKTGKNNSIVSSFETLTLDYAKINAIGEYVDKTYGIATINSLNVGVTKEKYQSIIVMGKSEVNTKYTALFLGGKTLIEGGNLKAVSENEEAVFLNISSRVSGLGMYVEMGELEIKNCNIDFKGKDYGIRGHMCDLDDNNGIYKDWAKLTMNNVTGTVEGADGAITRIGKYTAYGCEIVEPKQTIFDVNQHAICDAGGNIITGKVSYNENVSPTPGDYITGYPKATGKTTIDVKWHSATDNNTHASDLRYYVTWSDGQNVFYSHPKPYPKKLNSYTITGLKPNETYNVNVWVVDNADNTASYGERTITTLNATENYNIKIAGVDVTSENYNNLSTIDGVSGTVHYDPGTETLTLNNAIIEHFGDGDDGITNSRDGLKINLIGQNKIICDGNAMTIYRPTTITGSGNDMLEMLSNHETALGLYNIGDVTFENCIVTLNSYEHYALNGNGIGTFGMRNALLCVRGNEGAIVNLNGEPRLAAPYIIDPNRYDIYDSEGSYIWSLMDSNRDWVTNEWVKITQGTATGVETVRTDEPAAVSEIYSPDGRRQNEMKRGLNIVRMTDGTAKKVIVK